MSFGKEPPDIEASEAPVAEPLFSKFFSNNQRNRRRLSRIGVLIVLTNLVLASDIFPSVPQAWYEKITGRDRPWYASSPSANREFLTAVKNLTALGSFNDRAAVSAAIGVELKEKIETGLKGEKFYSFVSSQEGHWWKSIYVEDDMLDDDKDIIGNQIGSIGITVSENVCVTYEDVDKAIGAKSMKTEPKGNEYIDIHYSYKPIKIVNGYLYISMLPANVLNHYSCIKLIAFDNRSTLTAFTQ